MQTWKAMVIITIQGGLWQRGTVNPKYNVANRCRHLLVFTPGCVVL